MIYKMTKLIANKKEGVGRVLTQRVPVPIK